MSQTPGDKLLEHLPSYITNVNIFEKTLPKQVISRYVNYKFAVKKKEELQKMREEEMTKCDSNYYNTKEDITKKYVQEFEDYMKYIQTE